MNQKLFQRNNDKIASEENSETIFSNWVGHLEPSFYGDAASIKRDSR